MRLLQRRIPHSAQVLRGLLGTIRLEPVKPDIYRASTTLDALALTETPSGQNNAEGGSNSFRRWRRRESNPETPCGVL